MTGYQDLITTFAAPGLGDPPVPVALADGLVHLDEWLWSTREIDHGDLYDPPDLIDEAAAPCPDYVAIGTAGHGMDSAFLTCRAVVGPLALFVQGGWGGAHGDEGADAARLTTLFAEAAHLVSLAEGRPADGRRLLVVVSPEKSLDLCQWVPMDGRTWRDRWLPRTTQGVVALGAARRALDTTDAGAISPTVDAAVHLEWRPAGRVEQSAHGPWIEGLPATPAIYRIRFVGRDGPWIYVGETMNLARRMIHYRVGDPKLRTNAAVHELIVRHLDAGKVIELDVALEAWLTLDGVGRPLSLGDKLDRVLAESAAISSIPAAALLNKRPGARRRS